MLKELKTQHREIARLTMEGVKPTEIATRLKMAATSVYSILRDPLCKSYIAGLNDKADLKVIDVRERLAEMNTAALDGLAKIISNKEGDNIPAQTLLSAINSVLDRNGYKAPEQHNHAHAVLTMDDILKIRERSEAVDIDYMKTIN